jgi:hypothetical protein
MKKFLLIVTLILLCFINVEAQVAAVGDFRSVASGSWHTLATWQVRSAVNTWATATVLPTSTNNVYIQINHLITVSTADAVCKDLNVHNTASALAISAAFNVNVYGKIRAMLQTAADVTTTIDGNYTGASTVTGLLGMITTTSTGLFRFVGASRTIGNTGEWTSAGNSPNTEFALDPGATGLFVVGYKGNKITFSSGSISVTGSNLIACSKTATDSSLTIRSGAKLTTDASTKYAIGASSSSRCNLIVIQSGGTLEFTGAVPNISTAKFVNNGTIIYTSSFAQNLLQNILQGTPTADITVPLTTAQLNTNTAGVGGYSNIQISGATAHTVTAFSNITISGSLQLDSAITLDMSLTGAYDITGTLTSVNNNGTI